jgi:hypothetical protein
LYDASGLLPDFAMSIFPNPSGAMSASGGQETRRYSRVQLPLSAEVSCLALARLRQPGHLRDVSAGGAFFYADIHPPLGAMVKLDFTVQVVGGEIQISCEGPVVRTEPFALGQHSGIAIQFSHLHLGS